MIEVSLHAGKVEQPMRHIKYECGVVSNKD
jgi:hypothetical protein